MKYAFVALCALFAACDDGDSNTMVDGDGTLGVAVEDLSKWGLDACPAGLEDVDGVCVAGTVDMQLDIDDCRAVAHCFKPLGGGYVFRDSGESIDEWSEAPSCAKAVVVARLDKASGTFTFAGGRSAQAAAYETWGLMVNAPDDRRGLYTFSSFNNMDGADRELTLDRDGVSACLFEAEPNVVQDRWRWSKVRSDLIARDMESQPERW